MFLETHKKLFEKSLQQTLHIKPLWWNNILRYQPLGPHLGPRIFPMALPPTQAQCTLPWGRNDPAERKEAFVVLKAQPTVGTRKSTGHRIKDSKEYGMTHSQFFPSSELALKYSPGGWEERTGGKV